MVSSFRPPMRILGVGEQWARIRLLYPDLNAQIRNRTLICEGGFKPTSLSPIYDVRIEYKVPKPPSVHVISPPLVPRISGGSLKHVYPGNRLCLFLPGSGEWTAAKSIAGTIIPWTSEWLFFHEIWIATGKWLGGGVEPQFEEEGDSI